MIKKVCLLVDRNMYETVNHFTDKLAEAMTRKGIEVRVFDVNMDNLNSFPTDEFKNDPPDITCSFNNFDKLSNGQYLWEILEIPHVAFLLDPPIYYLDQAESPYVILTCVDRYDAKAVQKNFSRAMFWPHGVENDLHSEDNVKRDIDVVFFGSCFDFIKLRKDWKKHLTGQMNWVIDFATDIALINSSITLTEALMTSWKTAGLDNKFGQENFFQLYHYFEKFMIGKDRFELIKAIRDVDIHIYGEPFLLTENRSYPELSELFPDKKNVIAHPPVNYSEMIEILKRSKICLNSSPSFRDGTHDRIFTSLACGALPIVSDSKYLGETLLHGVDILYYKANHWHEVNDWINEYLADEQKRKKVVASGREKVMKYHTWDVRIEQLMEELPPILESMKRKA